MLKKILAALAAVFLTFLVFAALQPSEFRVERTAIIEAPASKVYDQVNDFKNWPNWSPWEHRDPTMKKTYTGSSSGTGAIYSWVGNSEVGEGRMTITSSVPHTQILILLEFLKPFAVSHQTEFTFRPEGTGTQIAWIMSGKNNFFSKVFSIFMSMDKMIGKDFEHGLAAMKLATEHASTR